MDIAILSQKLLNTVSVRPHTCQKTPTPLINCQWCGASFHAKRASLNAASALYIGNVMQAQLTDSLVDDTLHVVVDRRITCIFHILSL